MQRAAQLLIWLVLASALPAGPAAATAVDSVRITGRITGPDGQPAPAVTLRLVPILAPYDQAVLELAGEPIPESVATASSDDRGAFHIDAPEAGFWRLLVSAPKRMPMELAFRREPLLEATAVPTLELELAESAQVRVVDRAGAAVSGAWVDPRIARRDDRWLGSWRPHLPPRRTGAQGRATLDLPADATIEVRAWKQGYAPSTAEPLRPATVSLELARSRARHLLLVDSARQPIAGAVVRVGRTSWPATRSDDAGRVVIHDPRATILSPDGRQTNLELADGEGLAEAPFELTVPAPLVIAGRVVDDDSRRPVVGAFVYPTAAAGRFVSTDANGGFSLTAADSGDSWISVGAAHYLNGRSLLPPSTTAATIALAPAIDLPGVVIDAAGQPVSGAVVRAAHHRDSMQSVGRLYSGPNRQATTAADGTFVLPRLATGASYAISASADGLAPAESIVTDLRQATDDGGVVLQLDTGALISGQVVDPAGVGVVGATVTIEREAPSAAMRLLARAQRQETFRFEVTSGTEGEFAHPLTPVGRFVATVKAPGFPLQTSPTFEIEAGMRGLDLGVITLEQGVELTGRVVDPDDLPLAAAKVTAREPQSGIMTRFADSDVPAVTDADGVFTISDRRAGEHLTLAIELAGYASRELPRVEVPAATLVIVLEPAVTLRGTVVDPEGQPIARASVSLIREGGGSSFGGEVLKRPIAYGATDPLGNFEIADVEPQTVRILVAAQGWLKTETGAITLVAGTEPEAIEIELRPGASVSGRVIGPDGAPVAEARINLEEGARFSHSSTSAISDGNGAYRLGGLEPGARMITVASNRGLRRTQELEVKEGDNTLDFYLEAGIEVSGTVVDGDARPVSGATVAVSGADSFSINAGNSAKTDAAGDFTIANVQPGLVTVTAAHSDYATTALDAPLEISSQPVTGLLLRMTGGAELTGSVLGADASDLAAMQIIAVRLPSSFQQGTIDSDGGYRVANLGPGSWQVVAQSSSGQRATGTVEIGPGETQVTLDLELGGGLTLSGRVLIAGKPLTGAWIAAVGTDSSHSAQGETDYQGRFELEGLEAGHYTVQVTDFANGVSHLEQLDLLRDDDIVIDIEGGTISGRVSVERGGAAVAGASVILEPLASGDGSGFRAQPRGSTTDGDGRFQLTGVAGGDYRLQASKEGYAAQTRSLQLDDGVELDGVDFELVAADGLTLVVRLPSGAAPATVSFAVLDLAGGVILTGREPATSEGRVRLETVPDGDWTLLIETSGTATHSLRAQVPEDDLVVQLATAATLEVSIPSLADDSSAVATLTLRGDDGLPFRALGWSGDVEDQWRLYSGQATLDSLPAGRWILAVTSSDGRSWQQSVTVAAGGNDTVVFE